MLQCVLGLISFSDTSSIADGLCRKPVTESHFLNRSKLDTSQGSSSDPSSAKRRLYFCPKLPRWGLVAVTYGSCRKSAADTMNREAYTGKIPWLPTRDVTQFCITIVL